MVVEVSRRLFTVEEYHQMAQAGLLTEDDRVELIEGEIVEMSPIGSRHQACVDQMTRLLVHALQDRAILRVQGPIQLSEQSEPQPDLALLRPSQDGYVSGHPGPDDVLLAVEVAETTADYDSTVKSPLFARYGIPETWVVDLGRERVEVHREPSPDGYRLVRTVRRGETLSPESLPDLTLQADDLLG